MSSDVVIAPRATVRTLKWSGVSIVVAALMTLALAPLATAASAAGTPSTLCSGYAGCTQGSFSTHGYQNASGTSYWTMYAGNNCTNYVAYVESTTFRVPTPTYDLGNGSQWAAAASEHGVVVNNVPSVGAVAVWTGAMSGMPASGHVAVVEAVGPRDAYVVISQQHMIGADGYDWVRITRNPSGNAWQDWPTRFIHFPSPTVTAIAAAVAHVARG
jgi:surface antigen